MTQLAVRPRANKAMIICNIDHVFLEVAMCVRACVRACVFHCVTDVLLRNVCQRSAHRTV